MLIGVVSDTHGHAEFARDAARMLESFGVEVVLHCGDIGSPEIIHVFKAWPTHYVFGNVDYDHAGLKKVIEAAGQTCHGRFGSFTLDGTNIALLHSDDAALFTETVNSGRFGIVCYGHTHVAKQEWRGDTLVLNPGALYRATPHTVAIVDLPSRNVETISV